MSTERVLRGAVVLPSGATTADRALVLVEVRDVSLMDVPSVVTAEWRRDGVRVGPGARVDFELRVPPAAPGASLSLRAHVSMDGSGVVRSGDGLTTTSVPVPAAGPIPPLEVPVTIV
jgi:uncharacterized lipoprotein YbaY